MSKDKIGIEGIKIYAYHGYYEEERQVGREFTLDIYIETDLSRVKSSDKLTDTINYDQILSICKEEMAITSNLLEHVASRIGHRIKALATLPVFVTIRISKHHPGLPVQIDRFFVEMTI